MGELPEPQWTIATSTLYQSPKLSTTYYDRGIRFLDINGDGLPDFIRSYASFGAIAATSTPRPEDRHHDCRIPQHRQRMGDKHRLHAQPHHHGAAYEWQLVGLLSIQRVRQFHRQRTDGARRPRRPLPIPKAAASASPTTPSTQLSGNNELPYEMLVATAIGTYDGLGNAATTTYTYSGGNSTSTLGMRDRKFAGFACSTATLPDSIVKTYFDQGVSVNTSLGEQADGYAQINHPFRKDVLDLSSNLIQSNFYRWDSISRGNGSYFVNLGRQVEQDYASDGTHRDKATDYTYSTSTDDLLVQDDYGEVLGGSDGTFSDIGTDERLTTMHYAASSSINLSALIEKVTVSSALVKVLVVGGGGGRRRRLHRKRRRRGRRRRGLCLRRLAHRDSDWKLPVTVGNGGPGGAHRALPGQNGDNSTFDTLTAHRRRRGRFIDRQSQRQERRLGRRRRIQRHRRCGNSWSRQRRRRPRRQRMGDWRRRRSCIIRRNGHRQRRQWRQRAIERDFRNCNLLCWRRRRRHRRRQRSRIGRSRRRRKWRRHRIRRLERDCEYRRWWRRWYALWLSLIHLSRRRQWWLWRRHHRVSDGEHHRNRRHCHDCKRCYTIHTFTSGGTWKVTGVPGIQTNATTTDTRLYYDNLPFGQVSLGNNTRQEDWISGSTFASSTKTYNAYGLVATSTDRRGYATGYKYDAFNLYVATATNPLNQQTQYTYNYSNGKVKLTTDPNSRLGKNIYDGVGRLVEVDQSDISTPSLLATSTTYQYTDNTTTPSIVHRADYLTATNTVDTYDYYDGFNRLVQERKASQTAGTYVAVDRLYNPVGLARLDKSSLFLLGFRLYHADKHHRAVHHLYL